MKSAEQHALEATSMGCFSINIPDLRNTVKDILSQFGKNGIFEFYTCHDIKHIDEMLNSLDWIITPGSRDIMTPADWFMTVVSIFLHDIGLLVTKSEFDNRYSSGFPRFVEERLYTGDYGSDYKERILSLPIEERDRFLYEEFTREYHGKRARAWVEGVSDTNLGISVEAFDTINRVLSPLNPLVREDIGVLIESHNLDDLKDRVKYPLVRPYENNPLATANLQYCAVLLRTTDLLQITSDRAPTRLFKIINPSNPISQNEWVKQNGVRRIKNASKRDDEGAINDSLPQDTVEIFAKFNKQGGYFGLNAFLDYAEKQLQASHEIVETAIAKDGCKHSFPWKRIDRDQIEADGFIKKQFKFELDQEKILNLLTGHTLYNDSLVVIRELAQNALDAVRLYGFLNADDKNRRPFLGRVTVRWNAQERDLEVVDNGTGMSLDVIERHLLKVGSSKYQEPSFKKQHPNFHAISRFGIGVLSAFMVADEVSILTLEDHDEEAKEVSLESVHGRYLIKLLKKSDPKVQALGSHGTKFRLKLRASASANNLLNALRHWVLIPNCDFRFEEVGQDPVIIGYASPAVAIEALMLAAGYNTSDMTKDYRIVEESIEGVNFAYALKWSEAYREFSLLESREKNQVNQDAIPPSILCVHGIAVEFSSPGFKLPTLVAIADATGPNAPKTNVARTMLEMNEQTKAISKNIYKSLVNSIISEVDRLIREEGFTITRATNEAVFLSNPLGQENPAVARYPEELKSSLDTLPVFLIEGIESDELRLPKSRADMDTVTSFWTVEGEVVRSAENLLAQFQSDKTIKSAIETLSNGHVKVPSPLLCNLSSLGAFQASIFDRFQITKIEVLDSPRQINFLWMRKEAEPLWKDLNKIFNLASTSDRRVRQAFFQNILAGVRLPSGLPRFLMAQNNVELTGDISFGAIRAYRCIFLMPDQPIVKFFGEMTSGVSDESVSLFCYMCVFMKHLKPIQSRRSSDLLERAIRGLLQQLSINSHITFNKVEEFVQAMLASDLSYYDPFIWSLRSNALYSNVDDDFFE